MGRRTKRKRLGINNILAKLVIKLCNLKKDAINNRQEKKWLYFLSVAMEVDGLHLWVRNEDVKVDILKLISFVIVKSFQTSLLISIFNRVAYYNQSEIFL